MSTNTDLVKAILKNNLVKVKELVETKGFDVNHRGEDGETLLHLAAQVGNIEMIDYLISKGAIKDVRTDHPNPDRKLNPNLQSGIAEYHTPLIRAIQFGNLNVVKHFGEKGWISEQKKSHADCLRVGVLNERLDILKYLCSEAGVDPDSVQFDTGLKGGERTAFILSAGKLEYLKYFHSIGCNVNALSGKSDEWKPEAPALMFLLHLPVDTPGRIDCVDFLLQTAKVDLSLCKPSALITISKQLIRISNEELFPKFAEMKEFEADLGESLSLLQSEEWRKYLLDKGVNPLHLLKSERKREFQYLLKQERIRKLKVAIPICRVIASGKNPLIGNKKLVFNLIIREMLNCPTLSAEVVNQAFELLTMKKTLQKRDQASGIPLVLFQLKLKQLGEKNELVGKMELDASLNGSFYSMILESVGVTKVTHSDKRSRENSNENGEIEDQDEEQEKEMDAKKRKTE